MNLIKQFKQPLFYFSIGIFVCCSCNPPTANKELVYSRTYYFSQAGDDRNIGSIERPFKSIMKLNQLPLKAGDSVLFKGGQTFNGSIFIDSAKSGTADKPIIISTYGMGKAVIDAADSTAIKVYQCAFLKLTNLTLVGAGRKTGNTKDGMVLSNCHDILVDSFDITGFQKSGLLIYCSYHIDVNKVYAHNNGAAGIFVSGEKNKTDCSDIHISNSVAENNPGDPTNFVNHSGNGILAGMCRRIIIEYCSATNNGWDMPRKGNGPVGIWTYESDSVLIQHCISFRNKTSPGAADGGGFDLDGGVTNAVIQYCLSYENDGSGFGIFQYAGASNWRNNTIRFCISENDGGVSAAHAGVFVWNSSDDSSQLSNLLFYNNTIYNGLHAAVSFEKQSLNSSLRFYNNIFISKVSLITGEGNKCTYIGNDWYSLKDGFNAAGIKDFNSWAIKYGKEQINGAIAGFNINPAFMNTGMVNPVMPGNLPTFNNYKTPPTAPFRFKGIDLLKTFGIDIGNKDFNQQPAVAGSVGASF